MHQQHASDRSNRCTHAERTAVQANGQMHLCGVFGFDQRILGDGQGVDGAEQLLAGLLGGVAAGRGEEEACLAVGRCKRDMPSIARARLAMHRPCCYKQQQRSPHADELVVRNS